MIDIKLIRENPEMVKENIIRGKSRKCVQNRSDKSSVGLSYKSAYVCVGKKHRKPVFKACKKGHKIRHPRIRKRNRQPEKRASQYIKRIRADKISTQVRIPVPKYISAFYTTVHKLIKRDLLNVIIAVIYEKSPVDNKKRYINKKHHSEA